MKSPRANKTTNANLPEKRAQWLEVLSGKDPHSISRQLKRMAWAIASFRVINEARRLAPPDKEGGVQLNSMMHQLLDHGFLTSQSAAVRRLTDDYSLEGTKAVYSLIGLLNDIQSHRHLMTREGILKAENLLYDYEPVMNASLQLRLDNRGQFPPYQVCDSGKWMPSKIRHNHIDFLAGKVKSNRNTNDTLRDEVIEFLKQKSLSASQKVCRYVDKHIAHAAAPGNRGDVRGLSLDDLDGAYQNLAEASGFISIYVLGDSCAPFLSTPQYDQFQYLDRPLITESNLPKIQKEWELFDRDCHKWSQWGIDEYDADFQKQNESE